MLKQALLGRLVVIWRHLQRAIRARLLRVLRQVDGFAGRIAAGAGEHFDFAAGKLDGQLDDMDVFVVVESGRFARGADGDNAINAAADLRLDQALQGGLVNLSIPERSNNRSVSSSKHVQSIKTNPIAPGKID